ncbi:MAG TPA: carboxypeptidase-like regulatory domain-containing protein, partial [Pyrinomonadaceae bacterium]|nr:carboxypeptidase-like regulatory domain-containing protein [Pyrinomonadaceae bacterium]
MRRYYGVLLHFAAVLGLCALMAGTALSQETTGDISGRVTDALGNVVPNATVTAHNQGTGLTRTATTNESGDFTVALLPAGRYDVSVEAASFSKALLKDLELNVGATQTVKIELKPGEITETVEVASDAALVETTTS